MLKPRKTITVRKGSEKGQDLAEYAVLFSLIVLVVVLVVTLLGTNLSDAFYNIASGFGDLF